MLYSRASTNATGVVLGGLIGAGIQSSIQSSKDTAREKEILPFLESTDCTQPLIDAFSNHLETQPDVSLVSSDPISSEHLLVELTVDRCGFKLVDSERMFVSSFAEARYRIYKSTEPKPKKAKRLLVIDKVRSTWSGLVSQSSDITPRFEGALQKAGKRLANKVIYQK